MGTVYLLHFSERMDGGNSPGHYLGFAQTGRLVARLAEHAAGLGSCITAAAHAQGIRFSLGYALVGTRQDERRLKRCGNLSLLCVYCRDKAKVRRAENEKRRRWLDRARRTGRLFAQAHPSKPPHIAED